jgi:hypothetical protein
MAEQRLARESGRFPALARGRLDAHLSQRAANRRDAMKDDVFNMEIRKFLKTVGVTSQREIERAVREAIAAGRIKGNERLKARVTLTIEAVGLSYTVEDGIALE